MGMPKFKVGLCIRVYRPTLHIIDHFGEDFTGEMTEQTV